MTVEELAVRLEERIPASLSEPWDHDGRMVMPERDGRVNRVLCVLDCTSEAIRRAKEQDCNVIVSHHPLLFHPLASLTEADSVGKRVLACVKAEISVLSYHTRLDSMEGGVNDCLAAALGVQRPYAFLPYGRIGEVEPQSFEAFYEEVSERLHVAQFPCVKASDTVRRVAVVSGCGKDEIAAVLAAGADTYVTGEVMHNHMIDCKELGLNLLCATHYATERVVVPFLGDLVRACGVPAVEYPFTREDEYGV